MTTRMRTLLDHALDLLETDDSPEHIPAGPDLISAVAEAARNSNDINVKLGMNYLRGEVEVLTDERNQARARANETLEDLRRERQEWSAEKYRLQSELRVLGQEFRDYKISHPETRDDCNEEDNDF